MSNDDFDLDATVINLNTIDDLVTSEVVSVDLDIENKRQLVSETLNQRGFNLGSTTVFGNLAASGAKGLFADEWNTLMSKLPNDSVEALATMFRVNIYFNPESKTIVVNPEVNKGSDTSIWGVLSMVEHAALYNLAFKVLPSDQIEAILASFELEDKIKHIDPVLVLAKQYRIMNLLDLRELDFEGASVQVPNIDIERFVAVSTMSRLYKNTATLAPDVAWQAKLTEFYEGMGIRNMQVFENISEWIGHLFKK